MYYAIDSAEGNSISIYIFPFGSVAVKVELPNTDPTFTLSYFLQNETKKNAVYSKLKYIYMQKERRKSHAMYNNETCSNS